MSLLRAPFRLERVPFFALLGLALLVSAPASVLAIDCFDHTAYGSWLETDSTVGSYSESVLIGDYLYVAAGTGGIRVFDVSDPDRTANVFGTFTSGTANDVVKFGSLMLVADGSAGLSIFEVSNPAAPQPVTTEPMPAPALGVAYGFPGGSSTAHAFVACGAAGLVVVNCQDISDPILVGSLDTPGSATEVHFSGDLVYIADGTGGLQIADVSDPTQPELIGEEPSTGTNDLVLDGTLLYAAGISGMRTIDVGDPTNPVVLSSAPNSGSDLAVEGDRLAIAGDTSVHLFDRSDPAHPAFLGSIVPGTTAPSGVALRGTRAYVSTGLGGLETMRLTESFSGPALEPVASGFGITSVAADDRIYVLGTITVRIYDRSSPPQLLGTLDPPGGSIHAMDVEGTLLYLMSIGLPLRIFDVSDPSSPQSLGSAPCPVGYFTGVDVRDGIAYLSGSAGLTIFDVTTPSSPAFLTFVPHPGAEHAWAVEASGDHAYVAMRFNPGVSGIRVYDVANPAASVARGWIAFPGGPDVTSDLAVSGTFIYLANERLGAPVIDATDPDHPIRVADIPSPTPVLGVAVQGSVLTAVGSRVTIADISDPGSPRTLGLVPGVSGAFAVSAHGPSLVVCGIFGTGLLPAQCVAVTAAPEIVGASAPFAVFPNPVRGEVVSVSFDAPRDVPVDLRIVDVAGRRVRTLLVGAPDGPARRATWDARDEAGRRVAPGVYFVRLETPSGRTARKLVVAP